MNELFTVMDMWELNPTRPFYAHNKLYSQLVNERYINVLKKYTVLLDLCSKCKDRHFNDSGITLDRFDFIAGNLWHLVDHKLRKEIGVCNSLASKVCVLKTAIRMVLNRSMEDQSN